MPEQEPTAPKTRDQLLTQSYSIATTRLRSENKDRFNELRVAAAQELGIEWSPPQTAEERAEETIRDLLDEFPHLAKRLLAEDEPEAATG